MSQDSNQVPHLSGRKCASCGLVNARSDKTCRRCGKAFGPDLETLIRPQKRTLWKRISWVLGATSLLLIIFYASLLISSDSLTTEQRKRVESAIYLIRKQGFTREAFVLNHLASFRATDNWLNNYVGHHDAYAATNFPFEIVTLYPEFFEVPIDDTERAAVLLHEARHLLGDNEDAALENGWKNKRQLGWTTEKYSQTKVWDATMRLTKARFPYMFVCGGSGESDCY